MIVYNMTCKLRWEIADDWLVWQLGEQIPAILATGRFDDYRLFRLLEQEEDEGPTFVIQFFTSSLDRYRRFAEASEPSLKQVGREKWGDRYIAFQTLMESI